MKCICRFLHSNVDFDVKEICFQKYFILFRNWYSIDLCSTCCRFTIIIRQQLSHCIAFYAHSVIVQDFVIHTVSFLSISWANAFFVDSFVRFGTALVLSWVRCEIPKRKMEEGTATVAAAIISSTFFSLVLKSILTTSAEFVDWLCFGRKFRTTAVCVVSSSVRKQQQ